MTFGIIWLNMIFDSLTPSAFAAMTYSISRWANICALTSRQRPGHERMPRMTMIMYILCSTETLVPMTADRIMANGMNGIEETISAILMTTISTTPPKYPAIPPRMMPMIISITTDSAPIVIVILPPLTRRENTSRPRPSVPNMKPLRPHVRISPSFCRA